MEVGKVRRREEWESATGDADGDKQDSSESGGEKRDSTESGGEKRDSSESGGEKRDSSESGGEKRDSSASGGGDDGGMFSDYDFDDLLCEILTVSTEGESDDELYNDGLRKLNDDEYERYCRQVHDSGGFDIDFQRSDIFAMGLIIPSPYPEKFNDMAEFAIQRKNEEEGKNLKLIKVIKGNYEVAAPMNYYITFEAEDLDTGRSDTYQAKVIQRFPEEKSLVPVFKVRESPAYTTE